MRITSQRVLCKQKNMIKSHRSLRTLAEQVAQRRCRLPVPQLSKAKRRQISEEKWCLSLSQRWETSISLKRKRS
ncbi:hypothetical protein FGO68_gene7290 [Halteria grandinella]|uniref:Uncharacterized protein n=1 Tax=Halteria grandinella TaxID=5974 RepID=A0A8J8P495_HALGN|nr:hypothetical protein FGO68_gene7290 [Halteria grandinella]